MGQFRETPFAGGTATLGPMIPGGTVSHGSMADGVVLDVETGSALPNVAISSLGTFAPCLIEEIEGAQQSFVDPVGIGTDSPEEMLRVSDGNLKIK